MKNRICQKSHNSEDHYVKACASISYISMHSYFMFCLLLILISCRNKHLQERQALKLEDEFSELSLVGLSKDGTPIIVLITFYCLVEPPPPKKKV